MQYDAIHKNPDSNGLIKRHEARVSFLGNISGATQYRWEQKGILPKPIKIGNSAYYRIKELTAAIDAM